ncbi:hypothetical protein BKA80DRAFT_62715 [Phyllosticta citrichinensis]
MKRFGTPKLFVLSTLSSHAVPPHLYRRISDRPSSTTTTQSSKNGQTDGQSSSSRLADGTTTGDKRKNVAFDFDHVYARPSASSFPVPPNPRIPKEESIKKHWSRSFPIRKPAPSRMHPRNRDGVSHPCRAGTLSP